MKIVIAITVLAGILFINSIVHINNVLAQTSYKKYGYEAILPYGLNGSNEVVAVKGSIYPYAQYPSSSHVDNMVYIYRPAIDSSNLSVGAGHMNFGSNNSWYMMYFDQGLNDNFHIIVQAQPTTTYTAEVFKYKCDEEPNDLGFEYPLPNNSPNAILIDATTKHECTTQSPVWLYHGGSGG